MSTTIERAQRLLLLVGRSLSREDGSTTVGCIARLGEAGLGLSGGERGARQFVERHPGVFEICQENVRFSSKAKWLLDEEIRLMMEAHEAYMVYALRKLLMLSCNEAIGVKSIEGVASSYGFPIGTSLREQLLVKYPQYFHLNRAAFGCEGSMKLISWDPALAIPSRDMTRRKLLGECCEGGSLMRKSNKRFSERGKRFEECGVRENYTRYGIPVEEGNGIVSPGYEQLLDMYRWPLPSPYEKKNMRRHDRLQCIALCHELLSLAVFKRVSLWGFWEIHHEFDLPDRPTMREFFRRESRFFLPRGTGFGMFVALRDSMDWNHVPKLTPYLQARKQLLQLMDQDCFMDDLFLQTSSAGSTKSFDMFKASEVEA